MNMYSFKKNTIILCESPFPTRENLVITFERWKDSNTIVDKSGEEYSISHLRSIYETLYVMK